MDQACHPKCATFRASGFGDAEQGGLDGTYTLNANSIGDVYFHDTNDARQLYSDRGDWTISRSSHLPAATGFVRTYGPTSLVWFRRMSVCGSGDEEFTDRQRNDSLTREELDDVQQQLSESATNRSRLVEMLTDVERGAFNISEEDEEMLESEDSSSRNCTTAWVPIEKAALTCAYQCPEHAHSTTSRSPRSDLECVCGSGYTNRGAPGAMICALDFVECPSNSFSRPSVTEPSSFSDCVCALGWSREDGKFGQGRCFTVTVEGDDTGVGLMTAFEIEAHFGDVASDPSPVNMALFAEALGHAIARILAPQDEGHQAGSPSHSELLQHHVVVVSYASLGCADHGCAPVNQSECEAHAANGTTYEPESADAPAGCFTYLGVNYWNDGAHGEADFDIERKGVCKCYDSDDASNLLPGHTALEDIIDEYTSIPEYDEWSEDAEAEGGVPSAAVLVVSLDRRDSGSTNLRATPRWGVKLAVMIDDFEDAGIDERLLQGHSGRLLGHGHGGSSAMEAEAPIDPMALVVSAAGWMEAQQWEALVLNDTETANGTVQASTVVVRSVETAVELVALPKPVPSAPSVSPTRSPTIAETEPLPELDKDDPVGANDGAERETPPAPAKEKYVIAGMTIAAILVAAGFAAAVVWHKRRRKNAPLADADAVVWSETNPTQVAAPLSCAPSFAATLLTAAPPAAPSCHRRYSHSKAAENRDSDLGLSTGGNVMELEFQTFPAFGHAIGKKKMLEQCADGEAFERDHTRGRKELARHHKKEFRMREMSQM